MKNVKKGFAAPLLAIAAIGAVFVFAGTPLSATSALQDAPPALIYAGWFGNTTPTPSFVQQNQAFLDSRPFNGLVVYLRNPPMTINASMSVMTSAPISTAAISSVLDPMTGLTFAKLKNNFAYVLATDPPDFFDDWSVTIQNFANLAQALKASGFKGICFDNEAYFVPWASWPLGVDYPLVALADYQSQARLRGKQVMEAMVSQFADIVVITLHGPYISEPAAPWQLGFPGVVPDNALMGPFFVGMMEGSGMQARSVDGGELYSLRQLAEFEANYAWRKNDLASADVNCAFIPPSLKAVWPQKSSLAFGVYDMPSGGQPMDPAILQSTLTNALATADDYVWLYTESGTFLKPESDGGISNEWVDAVAAAVATAVATVAPPEPAPNPPPAPAPTPAEPASEDSPKPRACGLVGFEAVALILLLRAKRQPSGQQGSAGVQR